jgi:phosphate transport system permease protein
MKGWFRSGAPWIWITAGGVSVCLVMVLSLMLLIGWKGFAHFWPTPIYQWTIATVNGEKKVIGELYGIESVPIEIKTADHPTHYLEAERFIIRTLTPTPSFVSVFSDDVLQRHKDEKIAVVDRYHQGRLYGVILTSDWKDKWEQVNTKQRQLDDSLSEINASPEKNALKRQKWHQQQHELNKWVLRLKLPDNEVQSLPLVDISHVWYPNQLTLLQKSQHWFHQVWRFVRDDPKVANQQGGVFPAIFGTALMVILMSIMVVPFGVLAAVYLHEYAKKNVFTRLIRISVMNLAGVPAIVYGVFGLGFFVYGLGGQLDQLFYNHHLPSPTFGTPGILWSALTLALLTLPVVIVSTEEGLRRVPKSVRYGSLALGATKSETLWRVVLPMITPAIMTGVILAIARAAGEVVPLMLVGAVKMAPSLPIDGEFPYLHLERQFMHLGYHLYDVSFQHANVEAAKPLIYATAGLLLLVIIGLNMTAIAIRHYLNKKLTTLEN